MSGMYKVVYKDCNLKYGIIISHLVDTLCSYYLKTFMKILFCGFKGVATTNFVNCILNNSQTLKTRKIPRKIMESKNHVNTTLRPTGTPPSIKPKTPSKKVSEHYANIHIYTLCHH